jgi:D-alanyl-D-alanine carboxypeptidase
MRKTNLYSVHIILSLYIISIFSFPSNVNAQITVNPINLQKPALSTTGVVWPEIEAKSAFIYDPISNKILYQKDPDTIRPMASLNKIMTAAVADDLINQAPTLAEKILNIQRQRNSNRADISLKDGSAWKTDELLKYMLIGSSNKAAETIADGLIPRSSFLSLMNFTAKKIGLTATKFFNPTGLTVFTKKGNETTSSPGGISP